MINIMSLLWLVILGFIGPLTPIPSISAVPVNYNFECQGLPEDFIFWWACGAFGVCRRGQYVQVDCVNGTSYDRLLGECRDNRQGVSFPCNRQPGCLDYDGPGHRYPEMAPDDIEGLPACTFYYTCSYGRFLGHQRCNLGTVYHQDKQACLPPHQVPPPCGSYAGDDDDAGRGFNNGYNVDPNGNIVIPLPVDSQGNLDQRQWPFTNNNVVNNNRRPTQGTNRRPSVQQPIPQPLGRVFQEDQSRSSPFLPPDYQRRRFPNTPV